MENDINVKTIRSEKQGTKYEQLTFPTTQRYNLLWWSVSFIRMEFVDNDGNDWVL